MTKAIRDLWSKWWDDDIWITPWSKALAGLTYEQAAWSPSPGRHSIWQIVNHVVYWREVTLDRIAAAPVPRHDPAHDDPFSPPAARDEASWQRDRDRLFDSHQQMQTAMDNAAPRTDYAADDPRQRLQYHLAHDAYHLGQIMYLRAMQGLPPVL